MCGVQNDGMVKQKKDILIMKLYSPLGVYNEGSELWCNRYYLQNLIEDESISTKLKNNVGDPLVKYKLTLFSNHSKYVGLIFIDTGYPLP